MDNTHLQRDALCTASLAHWLELLFHWEPCLVVHNEWCNYLCHNSVLQIRQLDACHWTAFDDDAISLPDLDPIL